nr:hypothetical protein [Thaumasiovibrio occultus]
MQWLRRWIARYDAWCQRMGLVPENRRSCCPVRYDDVEPKAERKRPQ